MVSGLADLVPLWAATLLWLTLWAAYLSIVNVGQTWYWFGWESLLLETGSWSRSSATTTPRRPR